MAKHTPGPWIAGCDFELDDKNIDAEIWEKATGYQIVDYSHSDFNPETTLANARLIAVAPDMKKALEDLLHFHAHSQTHDPYFLAAKAALAKASGEGGHVCNTNTYPDCCYPGGGSP